MSNSQNHCLHSRLGRRFGFGGSWQERQHGVLARPHEPVPVEVNQMLRGIG